VVTPGTDDGADAISWSAGSKTLVKEGRRGSGGAKGTRTGPRVTPNTSRLRKKNASSAHHPATLWRRGLSLA